MSGGRRWAALPRWEGLQHADGHSHLLASTNPAAVSYDPAFTYEIAVIVREGLRRMYGDRPEDVFYYLGYAPVGTGVDRPVSVAGRRWAIEECFQAAKNECGLDHYEVRRYVGWTRHITLAMPAHALLAVTAAQAAAKGTAETVPPWLHSPRRKSAGCWQPASRTDPARRFASTQ